MQHIAATAERATFDMFFLGNGFNVMPPFFPGQFDAFVDQVVPILQEHGLFRAEYTGVTLRDHLGLKRFP